MTPEQVQSILHDFANRARRLRGGGADDAEAWRFEVGGRAYDLHYYPDDDTVLKRYVGGARAAREFTTLQAMQKLHVPAARVVANLKGFRIGTRKGDATILVHDAAATPLVELLAAPLSREERQRTTASLITLLESLHREKLCPVPLTLDAFARRGDGTVIVRDGGLKFEGVVTVERLLELDAATRASTTASERLRFWRHFTDAPAPRSDRALRASARRLARAANVDADEAFGNLVFERGGEQWIGRYLRRAPVAMPWSRAARGAAPTRDEWLALLPGLIAGDASWETMKDDDAATVRGGAIAFGGQTLDVVVKRPLNKPGARGWLGRLRPARVMRTWTKTWRMLGLGFRCEVPLLVIQHRRGPVLVDQMLVVERVPGPTLATVDLNAMHARDRGRLLHASGRVLRAIAGHGYAHRDAKAVNWIAWTDPSDAAVKPALIDLDGIRFVPWERRAGVNRLIRAMRTRDDVAEADIAAIQCGFAGPGT